MTINKNFEFFCEVKRETALAILINDGDFDAWIPKSQIAEIDYEDDINAKIVIPEWLAKEKGFI